MRGWILPVIIGVLWFWFSDGAPFPIWWFTAGLLLATPVLVHFAILRSLPEEVPTQPVGDASFPFRLDEPVVELERLGFERVGPLTRFDLPQPALLVPFKHPDGHLATAYVIETTPVRVAWDIVTVFDAPECALTTAMDHGAGVLPAGPHTLRQIFQDELPDVLFERHVQSVAFCRTHGLAPLDVTPAAVLGLVRASFLANRRVFLQHRIANTFIALWRTVTKRNPHLGALASQRGIADTLAAIPKPRRRRVAAPPERSRFADQTTDR